MIKKTLKLRKDRSKKIGTIIITAFITIANMTNIYASSNFDTIPSGTSKVSSSKVINYIDSKGRSATGNVYCIGQDKISYHTVFSDVEKDYKLTSSFTLDGKNSKTNLQLSNSAKQPKDETFQVKYKHNNTYYDNPPVKSGLDGYWKNANMTYNAKTDKWDISNLSGDDYIFTEPSDDKRGEWTIYVKAIDDTGNPFFDKESQQSGAYSTTFRVHKEPVPKFKFTENTTHATLTNNGSYDIDGEISKPNKGIKNFYWAAKIGDNWVDVGTGPTVTFAKNGKAVTEYRLTVEDYDGAFASISNTSLILDEPDTNFEFKVGGKTTTYAYKGNVGNETLTINPLISWKDEAFANPPYTSSGTRTEKWTAITSGRTAAVASIFNTNILKPYFSSIQSAGKINIKLDAKNKFDLTDTETKAAHVHNITTTDRTGEIGVVDCPVCNPVATPKKPFLVGTDAIMVLDVVNPISKHEELRVELNIKGLGVKEKVIINDTNRYQIEIPMPDRATYNKAYWDQFNYDFNVYSQRTDELLNTNTGTAYIHTPVNLKGLINGGREGIEVNSDDKFDVTATTEKYAETVTVSMPVPLTDYKTGERFMAGTRIHLKPNSSHTDWSRELMVDSDDLEEDRVVNTSFEAIAYNKRDRETDNIGVSLISFRLENLRITKVRDLRLEGYYQNPVGNPVKYVNDMAIDPKSFYPYSISALTKGYIFEFEIDSINFEGSNDTVFIEPSFYSAIEGTSTRIPEPKEAYWIDSNKKVWRVGQGGHAKYSSMTLTRDNRTNIGPNKSTWKGQYYIPGTTFLTNAGNTTSTAKKNDLKSDIIVNFNIEGLQNGTPKFNYNLKQWGKERTENKYPYEIGDIIRYGNKSNLDDLKVNRVH